MKMIVKQVPRAISYSYNSSNPKFKQLSDGIVVKHTEFFSTLVTPTTGNNNGDTGSFIIGSSHYVNPGNKHLFPWLSSLAANYETYRFRKLNFIFKPSCSTDTQGTVCIVMDFDPSDSSPGSKTEMMSYKGAVSGQPWKLIAYKPQAKDFNKEKTYYTSIRDYNGEEPKDVKLLDCGFIIIAMDAYKGQVTYGELYVDYEIEFHTPQMNLVKKLNNSVYTTTHKKNISATNDYPLGSTSEIVEQVQQMKESGINLVNDLISSKKGNVLNLVRSGSGIIQALTTGSSNPNVTIEAVVRNLGVSKETVSYQQQYSNDDLEEVFMSNDYQSLFTDVSSNTAYIKQVAAYDISTLSNLKVWAYNLPQDSFIRIYIPSPGAPLITYSNWFHQDTSSDGYYEF